MIQYCGRRCRPKKSEREKAIYAFGRGQPRITDAEQFKTLRPSLPSTIPSVAIYLTTWIIRQTDSPPSLWPSPITTQPTHHMANVEHSSRPSFPLSFHFVTSSSMFYNTFLFVRKIYGVRQVPLNLLTSLSFLISSLIVQSKSAISLFWLAKFFGWPIWGRDGWLVS